MKAVIMAGGEGKRLRPLTCTIPKPLVPLCGRPVIEYILDLLKQNGFEEAKLTLMYKGEMLENHFDDSEYNGISLSYHYEDEPLGTAGSVLNALDGENEILVISGDAMCDFDLKAAIDFHREKGADATIIVKSVPDPREYGLVLAAEDGEITGFSEKPSYEECVSELANTGVYILSERAIKLIPENKSSDFAQDIFPLMLRDRMKLFAFEEKHYWCDIGNIQSYIKCQKDMLGGRISCDIQAHKSLDGNYLAGNTDSNFTAESPVYIGRNVKIGSGCFIGGAVIGDNVTIGRNAKIRGSIIMNGAFIGNRVTCNEAVICEGARLLNGCSVFEGASVGGGALIGENAVVESGVRIWAKKQVGGNITASYDVKHGYHHPLASGEDGISGETGGEITPLTAAVIGGSVALIGRRIAVGYRNNTASKTLALAVESGISAGGSDVWDIGPSLETELDYAVRHGMLDAGIYIDAETNAKFMIISGDGLPLARRQERKLEAGLRGEYGTAHFGGFGEFIDYSSVKALYEKELSALMPDRFSKIRPEINAAGKSAAVISERIMRNISTGDGEKIFFSLSADGRRASAFSDNSGFVSYDRLVLICCKYYFERDTDVALPYGFPTAADTLAAHYGRKARRYLSCPTDESDYESRELSRINNFARDGLRLTALVLKYLEESGKSLETASKELPQFATSTRLISIEKSPAAVLKPLVRNRKTSSEGASMDDDRGRVILRPTKTGRSILVLAEAANMEAANELCDFYERKLNEEGNL